MNHISSLVKPFNLNCLLCVCSTSAAHELIEFVIDYVENVRDRPVLPSVEPGYLKPLLPDKAPYRREPWSAIMPDIEKYIMPGVSRLLLSVPSASDTPYRSVGRSVPRCCVARVS